MTELVPSQRAFAVDVESIERTCRMHTGFSVRAEEASFPFGLAVTGEFITTEDVDVVLPSAIYETLRDAHTRNMSFAQYCEFFEANRQLSVDNASLSTGQYAFESLFTPGLITAFCQDISCLPMARKILSDKDELVDIYLDLLDTTTIGYRRGNVSLVFLVQVDTVVYAVPVLYKVARNLKMTVKEALMNNGYSGYKTTIMYECLTMTSFFSLLQISRGEKLIAAHSAARQGVEGLARIMAAPHKPYSDEIIDIMMKMFLIALIQDDPSEKNGMDGLNSLCPSIREIINHKRFESFLAQIPHRPYVSMFGEVPNIPPVNMLTDEELTTQMNEYINYGARNVSAYYHRVNLLPQTSQHSPERFLWIKLETLTQEERKLAGQVIRMSQIMWKHGLAASRASVADVLERMPGYRIPQVALIGQAHALPADTVKRIAQRKRKAEPEPPTQESPSKMQRTTFDDIVVRVENASSTALNALRTLGVYAMYSLSSKRIKLEGPDSEDESEDETVDCSVQ